jgi:hypothetical protein
MRPDVAALLMNSRRVVIVLSFDSLRITESSSGASSQKVFERAPF